MEYKGTREKPQRKGAPSKWYAVMTYQGERIASELFDTEREAAREYDRMRAARGLPPVNVLRASQTRGKDVR